MNAIPVYREISFPLSSEHGIESTAFAAFLRKISDHFQLKWVVLTEIESYGPGEAKPWDISSSETERYTMEEIITRCANKGSDRIEWATLHCVRERHLANAIQGEDEIKLAIQKSLITIRAVDVKWVYIIGLPETLSGLERILPKADFIRDTPLNEMVFPN